MRISVELPLGLHPRRRAPRARKQPERPTCDLGRPLVKGQDLLGVVVDAKLAKAVVLIGEVTTGPITKSEVTGGHGDAANRETGARSGVEVGMQDLVLLFWLHLGKHGCSGLREASAKAKPRFGHPVLRADKDRGVLREFGDSLLELNTRQLSKSDVVLLLRYYDSHLAVLASRCWALNSTRTDILSDDAIPGLCSSKERSESPGSLRRRSRGDIWPDYVVVNPEWA
mmetsp:Transcript_45414/g.122250  ORF Transcript_45414/g.122250 Transcript_45414/m.122250 type:complete len:227 (+) Transcript_45414:253-933(+)